VALNRLLAFGVAVVLGLALYWLLRTTRMGTALRAIAIDPVAAQLVAIDVPRLSALAFAAGGALLAAAGALVSMFLSFNASIGIVYTLKALIVVIMGGVGR
jgi:branched-chain amino acid transport system permease protein